MPERRNREMRSSLRADECLESRRLATLSTPRSQERTPPWTRSNSTVCISVATSALRRNVLMLQVLNREVVRAEFLSNRFVHSSSDLRQDFRKPLIDEIAVSEICEPSQTVKVAVTVNGSAWCVCAGSAHLAADLCRRRLLVFSTGSSGGTIQSNPPCS